MKLFFASAFAALSLLSPALHAGTWSPAAAWTGDASTGITPGRTYWAYNFGSTTTAYVNGVAVAGIDGGNPAVAGRFSVSGIPSVFNGDSNDLTSLGGYGSAVMGKDFIYNGAPGTITLEGLTAGKRYVASIYGVGFDAADARTSEFYSEGFSLAYNENAFGNNKGLRVDYDFTATATTCQIILTPLAGFTFHVYGLALHRPAIMVISQLDDGNRSLRQAVADAASDDCILIDPVLAGEQITLTTPIGIFKSLSIDGSLAPGCRISGNHQSRIFSLQSFATTFHDRFYNLTLVDGNAGFSGGGAISSVHSNITVSGCTFTGNAASFGGAIKCDGNATLVNTTISGNTASEKGGAYQNVVGTTEFKHCTITNNSAPACGGILDNSIADTLLKHTIVSGNSNGDLDNTSDGSTTFASLGGNIIGTGEQLATFVQPGDQVGANPGLAPLASNGGLTPTMLPDRRFEAIDSGLASDVAIDQRGYLRDSSPDSGAVERGPGATVFSADDSGGGTLRDRLDFMTSPDSYINFSHALDGQAITLLSELYVPAGRDIEIDASFLNGMTLSGGGASRILFNQGSLRLNSLELRNGSAESGGAVLNHGDFRANDCTFRINHATDVGGAIFSINGSVDLSRCALFNNSARDSGAIWLEGTAFQGSLANCTVANNGSTGADTTGAITLMQGSLDLIHTTVTENTGHGFGGGFYLDLDAHLNFDRCVVAANHDTDSPNDDFSYASGTISTPGPNLVGNNSSVFAFFTFGDLVGSPVYPRVPLLAPGMYFGKAYITALLPGSPAINGAGVSPSAIDQLGIARSAVLPNSDLGAAEFFPLGPLFLFSNDGDTIPDILEIPNGPYPHLDPGVNDSALDTDGDGMTDAKEIGDSTDPLDSKSYFHITHFAITAMTPGSISTELDFTSVPGLSYRAEVSATLDFSSARQISFGEAQGPVSQYAPFLDPTEQFVRVRRVGAW